MVKQASLFFFSLLILAGCAGTRGPVTTSPDDYIEIENPAFTMSPNATPTIMVPRSSVEKGAPRGSALLEKGIESVRGGFSGSGGQQASAPQPAAKPFPRPVAQTPPQLIPQPLPQTMPGSPSIRYRIFAAEIGQNNLLPRFKDALKRASAGNVLNPVKASPAVRNAGIRTPGDRAALSVKLQEEFGANLVLFISAPEGVSSGKTVTVEAYDGHGGTLVRTLKTDMPQYVAADSTAWDFAVASAMQKLAIEVRELAAVMPWYAKVVAIDGELVYIDAGKESGIGIGKVLNIYRSGKVVKNLGFAPGAKIGTLQISGFVGTDGAFGSVKESGKIQIYDLVGLE